MEHRLPVCRAAPQLPNWEGGFLAREAQQQARKARQGEAQKVIGDAGGTNHETTIATAARAGN